MAGCNRFGASLAEAWLEMSVGGNCNKDGSIGFKIEKTQKKMQVSKTKDRVKQKERHTNYLLTLPERVRTS